MLLKKVGKSAGVLKQTAEKNTSIVVTKSRQEPLVIQEGTPLDQADKKDIKETASPCPRVGVGKGITKNMGDYSSLRVDVWLTDDVSMGETTEEAFTRVELVVDEVLMSSVEATIANLSE